MPTVCARCGGFHLKDDCPTIKQPIATEPTPAEPPAPPRPKPRLSESDYILCTNLTHLRTAEIQLRDTSESSLLKADDRQKIIRSIGLLIDHHEAELNRRMG